MNIISGALTVLVLSLTEAKTIRILDGADVPALTEDGSWGGGGH